MGSGSHPDAGGLPDLPARQLGKGAAPLRARRSLSAGFTAAIVTFDDLDPNEVVLATYGVVRRDQSGARRRSDWGLVITEDKPSTPKIHCTRTARSLRDVAGRRPRTSP